MHHLGFILCFFCLILVGRMYMFVFLNIIVFDFGIVSMVVG